MKEKTNNTTPIPTNLDTPNIYLAQAKNRINNKSQHYQNNLRDNKKTKTNNKAKKL